MRPDADVKALGLLSEALETVEQARGNLYAFHQLSGRGDLQLQDAVKSLREAGHAALADRIETQLVGHNVIHGRWTFQIVEEYDDGYWSLFRGLEREAREQIADGQRHLFEAEMKSDDGRGLTRATRPHRPRTTESERPRRPRPRSLCRPSGA